MVTSLRRKVSNWSAEKLGNLLSWILAIVTVSLILWAVGRLIAEGEASIALLLLAAILFGPLVLAVAFVLLVILIPCLLIAIIVVVIGLVLSALFFLTAVVLTALIFAFAWIMGIAVVIEQLRLA